MGIQITHKKRLNIGKIPIKKERILQSETSHVNNVPQAGQSLPLLKSHIHFTVIPPDVQMATRNNAYEFFSLDQCLTNPMLTRK